MTCYNTSRGMMYADLPTETTEKDNQTKAAVSATDSRLSQASADD